MENIDFLYIDDEQQRIKACCLRISFLERSLSRTYCGWACRKCDKNGRLCVLLEEGILTVLPRRPWVRENIRREDPAFWCLLEEDEKEDKEKE